MSLQSMQILQYHHCYNIIIIMIKIMFAVDLLEHLLELEYQSGTQSEHGAALDDVLTYY